MATDSSFRPFMTAEEVAQHQRVVRWKEALPDLPGEVIMAWRGGAASPEEVACALRISQRRVEWILDNNVPGWRWTLVNVSLQGKAGRVLTLADAGTTGATEIARTAGCSRQYVHRVLKRYRPDYSIRLYRMQAADGTKPKRNRRFERLRAEERKAALHRQQNHWRAKQTRQLMDV